MSMQDVVAFANAVESDPQMKGEMEAAVGGAKGAEAYAATARFAGTKGYDITADEVEQGYNALLKMESADGQLSDAELETVSGGKNSAEQNLGSAGKWLDNNVGAGNWKALGSASAWKKLFGI